MNIIVFVGTVLLLLLLIVGHRSINIVVFVGTVLLLLLLIVGHRSMNIVSLSVLFCFFYFLSAPEV